MYERARKKAEREGVSMSQVGAAGLEFIAGEVSRAEEATYLKADKRGVLRASRRVQQLPKVTCNTLVAMRTKGDWRLSPYLLALHEAGWSFTSLGIALGMSRQAVHERIQKCVPLPEEVDLPPVPAPEWLSTPPGKAGQDLRDWPVWVDRGVYSVVAQHARRHGTPMREVMEAILRDYLDGTLSFE